MKLSSGNPLPTDKDGNGVFGNSKVHTILLLLLFCRYEEEADPDEIASPWQDRPEVRSGRKSKGDYVREIYQGIDLVPPDILELVIKEFLDSDRRLKPSLNEFQDRCRAAMEMQVELGQLA